MFKKKQPNMTFISAAILKELLMTLMQLSDCYLVKFMFCEWEKCHDKKMKKAKYVQNDHILEYHQQFTAAKCRITTRIFISALFNKPLSTVRDP